MKNVTKLLAIILAFAFLLPLATGLVSGETETEVPNNETSPSAEEVIADALVMKVKADNSLLRGEKKPLFADEKGKAYGAPYKADGTVMVPLKPILDYMGLAYESDGASRYTVILSDRYFTLVAGNVTTEGTVILLTKAPVVNTFDTNEVMFIALDDVETLFEGYFVTYDASGMIFIAKQDEFVNRADDSDEQLIKDTAKLFIYSDIDFRTLVNADGKKLVADYRSSPIKDKASFIASFNKLPEFAELYNMFKDGTNNFQHPYIKTNQERFDLLNNTYLATESNAYSEYYDEELKSYIETQIVYADKYLVKYVNFNADGTYAGLKDGHWVYDSEGKANPGSGWSTEVVEGVENHSVSEMPYIGDEYNRNASTGKGYGQGYDPAGGRLNVLSDGEDCLVGALEPAALAYQITRDEKYLAFAYDWMVALCSWQHWGPGHYLNCANTARPLATAYDWLYNDFVRVYGQDAVDLLAERIYENAVYEATVTLTGNLDEHGRYGDSSRYWAHVGNWNSCGTLGMLIASLAVMDREEYQADCLYVIAASLGHYMERGMTYITLDGGYRESSGYWGTVRFMHMINKILQDTADTDFGLANYPGLDTSDYFGCMLESGDYKRWNYHDDWAGTQPSQWYYLSAELYDNPEYAAIRHEQIRSGDANKAPHRWDVLYYDKTTIDNLTSSNLPLDYSMTSIDATIVRDSWKRDGLFAGLMGGYNNVAHGQYDSGNWIYENKGVRWFCDLGADNYNLYGGGFETGYYKYSAEGNNTLALTSDNEYIPHGQLRDAKANDDTIGGQLISYTNNEYGSATVIDQHTVYGTKVEYAYRGMLVTNNRRTFVIQDEVKTTTPETFYWFAHYDTTVVGSVEISEDGRTAYMWAISSENVLQKLRVTLLSDREDLRFEIMDTYTFTLEATPSPDYSPSNKEGIREDNREKFRRLAIKCENVTELNLAVVIEIVNGNDQPELGYTEIVPMASWTVVKGDTPTIDPDGPAYTVYYADGSSVDFITADLAAGILENPDSTESWTKENVVRVECHDNVFLGVTTNVKPNKHLTINLNDNFFYQKKLIRVGQSMNAKKQSGSLTVNNGTWRADALVQLRYGTSFTVNDVDYATSTSFIRDEGAKVVINDSRVQVDGNFLYICANANYDASSGHRLIINNSEIRVTTSLIDFKEGHPDYKNYHDVFILGNSSIYIPDYTPDKLVSFTLSSVDVVTNFNVANGVKFNFEGIVLPDNVATDKITRTFTLSYRSDMSMNEDGGVNIGSALTSEEEGVYGYSNYIVKITDSGDEEYPYIVGLSTDVSFEVYQNDGTKLYYYVNDLVKALPNSKAVRVVILKDSVLTANVALGRSQTLLVDLNKKTLTVSARFDLGGSSTKPIACTFTVKNGNIVRKGGDGFLARLGTTLIFEDVNITSTGGNILWDNGASKIVFNRCTVNAGGSFIYSRLSVPEGVAMDRNMFIVDSTVNIGVAFFSYAEWTNANEYRDVYVLGDTKLTYGISFDYSTTLPITFTKADFRLHLEKGALVSKDGFGLPEDKATITYKAYGYEYVTLDDNYTIVDSYVYSRAAFVADGAFFTVYDAPYIVGVKSSLTLYSDFTINFFLPVEGNKIDKVVVYGDEYLIDENCATYVDENGTAYYKIAIRNVAPHRAAEDIEMYFYCGDISEKRTFSVIEYCKRIFSDYKYQDTAKLAASVVDYVNAAYEYTKSAKPLALTEMLASTAYKKNRPEAMPADITTTNKNNAGVAIAGAQLDIGASLYFRFNIKEGFTGTLKLNGVAYSIKDGLYEGQSFINIGVRAYDMYDPEKAITIEGTSSDGTAFSGTYDLRAYIINSDKKDVPLAKLLSALYTYCTEAYSYRYGIVVERPDIGNTPSIDIVLS